MKKKIMIGLALCVVATTVAIACDCDCLINSISDPETSIEDALKLAGAYMRHCL